MSHTLTLEECARNANLSPEEYVDALTRPELTAWLMEVEAERQTAGVDAWRYQALRYGQLRMRAANYIRK